MPTPPTAARSATIQGSGSISQMVSVAAGAYDISFLAAQRANGQPVAQQVEILIDNNQPVGLITPVGVGYRLYETPDFTLTAGVHTMRFWA